MADRAERQMMTLAEFLEWDDGSDIHYALIGGQVFAMSPPSDARGRIAGELGFIMRRQIKPPCQVVHQAGIALAKDRATLPSVQEVLLLSLEARQAMLHRRAGTR